MSISPQRLRVYLVFESDKSKWYTSEVTASLAQVAPRTARAHIGFLKANKIIDEVQTHPKLYTWSRKVMSTATKRLVIEFNEAKKAIGQVEA